MAKIDFFWDFPSDNPILSGTDVHVWCADLNQPAGRVLQLGQSLNIDETERANRFVFDHHRQHFVVGRGLLRTILGYYLDTKPEDVQFAYGPQGKPALAPPHNNNLTFNLSHSGSVALYAIARKRELGVDIEVTRHLDDLEQIAQRFFSPTEYTALRTLPEAQHHTAFFNCWTRKEAYIKAIGDGLSYPLDQFDVSLIPGEPAELLRVKGDAQLAARWLLVEMKPAPDYTAALIVTGRDWQLSTWQWPMSGFGR